MMQIMGQNELMNSEAAATGGHAYENINGIAQVAHKILKNSADFYTLTYSPNDLHRVGQWHKVLIKVAGPYHLSYRRGYFDENHKVTRHAKPLVAFHGEKLKSPDTHSNPIIFQARILPASAASSHAALHNRHKPPRGTRPYVVHYELPISAFHTTALDAQHSGIAIGFGAIILDSHGDVVANAGRLVKMKFSTAVIRSHPHGHFALEQPINIPRGEDDVYLAVWDPHTGRLGTLQIPLTVKKH